ncbi:3-dehydroquinate dehydratase [Bradyrhizobium sp. USDA 4472]
MLRSVLVFATAAVMITPTAVLADNKSDCQKGLEMIKAELKKKHPAPVIATLRKALSGAETEVTEEDWPECMDYIKTARAALKQ